jgi:serine/threonine-protein kinase RsbW
MVPAERPPFSLILPSELSLLPLARVFVETVCRCAGLDDPLCEAVLLATNEALQNIIRHAHHDNPLARYEIQCLPRPDGIEIRLLDEGQPFDVAKVPHYDPGELRIGGRGVFLMRRLMDELTSEPRWPAGNVLRMIKLRHRSGTTSKRHPA